MTSILIPKPPERRSLANALSIVSLTLVCGSAAAVDTLGTTDPVQFSPDRTVGHALVATRPEAAT